MPTISYEDQRVGVFVDVANMYYSAKNLFSAKVDFGKVLSTVVGSRKLIRAFAYVIKADVGQEKEFFEALEKRGFEVKTKDLQIFYGGAKKGDWDVGLTIDAVTMADKLDVIVLISGDGDYIPLVQYLQNNKGCKVEVAAFGKTTSTKLTEEADDFLDLGQSPSRFLIRDRRPPSTPTDRPRRTTARSETARQTARPEPPAGQ